MSGPSALGRLLRPVFALLLALCAHPALAVINCEILPVGPTFQSALTGETIVVQYQITGLGCGTVITTSTNIISDTTGSSVSPTSAAAPPGVQDVTADIGPTPGTLVFRVTCTSGCFGSPANLEITYTVNVTAPVLRTLDPVGPTSLTVFEGETRTVSVIALDDGLPAGTNIIWSASGPVSISPTSSNTNPSTGEATTVATFGPGTGTATIVGTRTDAIDAIVVYTFDVVVAPLRTISVISGDGQSGPTNTTLPAPLIIEAQDDGSPASGVGITWTVVSGDATLVAPTSPTDAAGRAQTGLQFGPTPGTVVVRAARNDDPSVFADFTLTSTLTRSLLLISGNGQSGPTNAALPSPLVIEARDNGLAASGIGITWTVVSGDATLVAPTSPTDTAGRAQTGLQFGPTPGTVVVRAARNDDPSVFADFTLTSTLTRTLLLISGNGQSGPTNAALPSPLVIEARDNGLAASGIGITWTVVSGDATLVAPTSPTDAAGRAQTGLQFGPTPGTVVVRAARNDDPSVFADFTLTSTLTRSLLLISGNGQSGPTNAALPSPLVIEARDNGLAASGIGITWTVVSGDATLVAPTSPTDTAGRAQTGLQFGPTPGTVVVRAARNDDPSVFADFSLTSTLVRTVNIVSGANQQGLPGLPLPSPIVVEVRANGLPEAGIEVDLSASGNASVAGSGATPKLVKLTDGAGRASFVVTLGPSPGPVTLTASLPADPGVSASTVVNASSLASLPGLPPELQPLGEVLEGACAAIAALPPTSRSPEQADLLARCQDFPDAPPAEVIAALRELVPDTTLVMVNIALAAGQAQLDNLKARIAALRSGTRGSAFGGLAIAAPSGRIPVSGLMEGLLGPAASEEVGADFDRFGWFVSGTLGRGESREGRLTPGYDFDINGLTAGLDYRFSDRFIAGASLGLTRQDSDLTGAQGKVEASGWSVSGYATVYQAQQWYSDAVLTWGRNEYDTLRRVRYTITGPGGSTTVDRSARGRLDGDLLSFAATVGRDWQAGGWTVGPYGRLLYTRIDFDSAREVFEGAGPGAGLALEILPGTHTSLASVAGAKLSRAISRDWGILMPHFQFEWEREYKEDPQRVGARFLADPSARIFTVQGDPIDNSFYRIGAGLSALFTGGRSGFIYVERVLGKSGFSQTNLALGLRGEF